MNPYKILGVDEKATKDEIKKAHRRLVVALHPDKNDGQPSQEFLEVQRAYEILSNDATRKMYDEHGFVEADQKYNKLMGAIGELIDICLQSSVKPGMLINAAYDKAENSLSDLQRQRQLAIDKQEAVENHRKVLKRKKNKDKDHDFIDMALGNMLKDLKAQILDLDNRIQFNKEILDILCQYEKGEVEVDSPGGLRFINNPQTRAQGGFGGFNPFV